MTRQHAKWVAPAVAAFVLMLPVAASAWSGTLLSMDGGILGTGAWVDPGPSSLSWEVTQNPDMTWHYRYLFSHPAGATSHFIIEVSPTFTLNDFLGGGGDYGELEFGWHQVMAGNPNMPEAIFGLKFNEATGTETEVWFDSFRAPMWGDFYAKNGRVPGTDIFNTAWNAGFAMGDSDPMLPPHDGPEQYHLLVPDTHDTPPVPEPSTLLLLGPGLIGLAAFMRRKRQ